MADYEFKAIEDRWRQHWNEIELFKCDPASEKPKFYCLMMFPYPSGDLHVGHGRNYLMGDTLVRHKIMQGYEVLSPMGWDAFGLPAENAAIKRSTHPRVWTKKNIGAMKQQFDAWGVGYDWSREVTTCEPDYYKWTQWVFCRLMDAGLIYRKAAPVNWCAQCQTVLANEQVVDGHCERCGSEVGKRNLEQWFCKITDYAQKLLDAIDELPGWPEQVRNIQRAHIGRSEGATVQFSVKQNGRALPCYTTRPDTLWGVTYFSVAPEHDVVAEVLEACSPEKAEEIRAFQERVKKQTNVEREQTKEGVDTGWTVINPVNGEEVPLYLANYVLMGYGTGAVMAVPAHDQRDFDFAKAKGLPMKVVIQSPAGDLDAATMTEAWTSKEEGSLVNSAHFDGTPVAEAVAKVTAWLKAEGKGEGTVQFRIHDWCISRQRYWGAPVPVIHCATCGPVRVPDDQLPVVLPDLEDFRPKGRSVLESVPEFMQTTCPTCGGEAQRDPDTLDTFVDSSWYFLRYPCPGLEDQAFDADVVGQWLPVHQYVGGREHARGHLLYSRFIVKALHDLGDVPFSEPFQRLFCQGMIGMTSFRNDEQGWVSWRDVETDEGGNYVSVLGDDGKQRTDDKGRTAFKHKDGSVVWAEYFKMSKTRLNLVSASEMGDEWGVDTQRLYTLGVGPAELDAEWEEQGVKGYNRFIRRVFRTAETFAPVVKDAADAVDAGALSSGAKDLRRKAHQTIERVSTGLELDREGNFGFHTAIAGIIELEHAFPKLKGDVAPADAAAYREATEIMIKLLAPLAPFLCEELWQGFLGREGTVFHAGWPQVDPKALEQDAVEIVVQIKGKTRDKIMVPPGAGEDVIMPIALERPKIKAEVEGKDIKKVIVVPNRLVNIVAV
jgi:leucyl-tRNA synthetase